MTAARSIGHSPSAVHGANRRGDHLPTPYIAKSRGGSKCRDQRESAALPNGGYRMRWDAPDKGRFAQGMVYRVSAQAVKFKEAT